jgi:hypothetical protein
MSNQPREGGRLRRAAAPPAGVAVGALLAIVAKLRGGKPVHPHGAVHAARLIVPDDHGSHEIELLRRPGSHPAIVRFSRSVGLPRPLPDLLGMAIRIPDAYGPDRHQDFLLVTSADLPIIHHVFLPARDVQQRPYTSAIPFRTGSRRFLVGALPRSDSPRPEGSTELARLAAAAATGALSFDLALAAPMGRFHPVAELRIGERLGPPADAIRFHPANCGGGLEPFGMLNRMRDFAYPMSQRAWTRR